MLKCYLSVTNHPAVHQFQDIHLSTHDFDRVSGANFDSVSGAELDPRLEQSLHTDLITLIIAYIHKHRER